jgi:hypothetical protein
MPSTTQTARKHAVVNPAMISDRPGRHSADLLFGGKIAGDDQSVKAGAYDALAVTSCGSRASSKCWLGVTAPGARRLVSMLLRGLIPGCSKMSRSAARRAPRGRGSHNEQVSSPEAASLPESEPHHQGQAAESFGSDPERYDRARPRDPDVLSSALPLRPLAGTFST